MSDKHPPSLNLIERMAQRLAKQDGAATKPPINGAEAPVPPANTAARAEPRFVPNEAKPTPAELPSATIVSAPAPEVARPSPSLEQSREVSLDFRVLRQSGMITPDNMATPISNEFRGIKRKLLQNARNPQTREAVNNLIMVTSSLPGEGKTFTSMNLAVSLAAERGLQVLLIDADVVRPSIGNMFKSTPSTGLTDLLNGKVSRVSDVMCRCKEIPNLSVMFSGDTHIQSAELISSQRMADLFKEFSKRYPDRVIVIDTSPVLATSEPATIASYVHQVVMVVAADQTDRHQLRKALEGVSGCSSVSLLFNKAPRWNEAEYMPYYGYAKTATPAAAS